MTVLESRSTDRVSIARRRAEFDSGIIVFCGIGLLLSLAATLFGWFGMAGAAGF